MTNKLPGDDGCRNRRALRGSPPWVPKEQAFLVVGISAACDACTFNETSDNKVQYGAIYKVSLVDQKLTKLATGGRMLMSAYERGAHVAVLTCRLSVHNRHACHLHNMRACHLYVRHACHLHDMHACYLHNMHSCHLHNVHACRMPRRVAGSSITKKLQRPFASWYSCSY